jgi:hypothetical protein
VLTRRPTLVGRIILARFLSRPAEAVEAAARAAQEVAEQAGLLRGPASALGLRRLPGSCWSPGVLPGVVCGRIEIRNGKPALLWRSPYFTGAYTVDRERLARRLARLDPEARETVLRAVRTLLLLGTRNRIAHEVARVLLRTQRDFLRTGCEARLKVLTEREVTREAQGRCRGADASRISRVLRSTVVLLPGGKPVALRSLCPSSRTVLRALVRQVLERERCLRARGLLLRAWTDEELAQRIPPVPRVRVSRRLVAYCRQSLSAPNAAVRSRHGRYMVSTMDFSKLAPLTRADVLDRAPVAAGVYELRLAPGQPAYEPTCAGIIYLGRAKNLRRRLLAHANPNGRNGRLASHVRQGRVLFRVRLAPGDLERVEKELYRQFVETYGHPPECNRLTP